MAKSPRNQFIAFEKEADAAINAMPLASLSARVLLTHLNTAMFAMLHVAGPKDRMIWKTGDTLSYRISYLVPWLRGRNDANLGADAADALQAVRDVDPHANNSRDLVSYAHFCEVMPEVHRRRLEVVLTKTGYRLEHPSAEFAAAEATDIIVSELALNHLAETEPRLPDEEIFDLAKTAPVLNPITLNRLLERRKTFYATQIREAPLVDDRGIMAIFGFTRDRFAMIQAAIFAIADVFSQLALVLWIWSSKKDGGPSKEALEWVTPCWNYQGFLDQVSALSGIIRAEIETFVEHFTLDYHLPAEEARGGDGFTPPFYRFADAILFSPDLIPRYCQPRNVLAHMANSDKYQKLYDELVSDQLEPQLVSEIVSLLGGFENLYVKENHVFAGGEFDIIISDKSGKHVVICEVKAPLPPQDSRPTRRLAERIQEGLAQIAEARVMDRDALDRILKNALGIDVSRARIEYVIVARACFGAIEVWNNEADPSPATLPLLQLALDRIRQASGNPARDLIATLRDVTRDLLRDADFRWEHASMTLFGRTIDTPQLLYDNDAVDEWMRAAHRAKIVLDQRPQGNAQ